ALFALDAAPEGGHRADPLVVIQRGGDGQLATTAIIAGTGLVARRRTGRRSLGAATHLAAGRAILVLIAIRATAHTGLRRRTGRCGSGGIATTSRAFLGALLARGALGLIGSQTACGFGFGLLAG